MKGKRERKRKKKREILCGDNHDVCYFSLFFSRLTVSQPGHRSVIFWLVSYAALKADVACPIWAEGQPSSSRIFFVILSLSIKMIWYRHWRHSRISLSVIRTFGWARAWTDIDAFLRPHIWCISRLVGVNSFGKNSGLPSSPFGIVFLLGRRRLHLHPRYSTWWREMEWHRVADSPFGAPSSVIPLLLVGRHPRKHRVATSSGQSLRHPWLVAFPTTRRIGASWPMSPIADGLETAVTSLMDDPSPFFFLLISDVIATADSSFRLHLPLFFRTRVATSSFILCRDRLFIYLIFIWYFFLWLRTIILVGRGRAVVPWQPWYLLFLSLFFATYGQSAGPSVSHFLVGQSRCLKSRRSVSSLSRETTVFIAHIFCDSLSLSPSRWFDTDIGGIHAYLSRWYGHSDLRAHGLTSMLFSGPTSGASAGLLE